jgi:putative MATE family efflux protein
MDNDNGLKLWKLSWPIFIQLLLVYGILLTDSLFLSKISDASAGSIGAIFPILAIFYMVFNQMGQAGCSVALQYIGAQKSEQASTVYFVSIILLAIIGGIASVIVFSFSSVIGTWVGLRGEGNAIAAVYLSIVGPALIFEAIKSAYNGILNSKGKTKWNMTVSIVYNVINIAFNTFYYYGWFGLPKSGVVGVAVSTVIAQLCGVGLLVILVHGKEKVLYKAVQSAVKVKTLFQQILKIGIPSSLEPVSVQVVTYVVTIFVVGLGTDVLATRTYVFNLTSLIISWSVAIGVGTLIIVAHAIGAKEFAKANRQIHASMLLSSLVCFGAVLILYLFANPILGYFTSNPEIIRLSKQILIVSLFWEPIRAINIILAYSLTSSGDARFSAFSGIAIMFGLGIPLCYLMGNYFGLGLVGIWIALLMDEAIRASVYYARWRSRKWEKYRIVSEEPNEVIQAG